MNAGQYDATFVLHNGALRAYAIPLRRWSTLYYVIAVGGMIFALSFRLH